MDGFTAGPVSPYPIRRPFGCSLFVILSDRLTQPDAPHPGRQPHVPGVPRGPVRALPLLLGARDANLAEAPGGSVTRDLLGRLIGQLHETGATAAVRMLGRRRAGAGNPDRELRAALWRILIPEAFSLSAQGSSPLSGFTAG